MKIDDYVLDVLMRDLAGHDHAPSAYLVYLHLWSQTVGRRVKTARLSHQAIADATGLSKSAVQIGMRRAVAARPGSHPPEFGHGCSGVPDRPAVAQTLATPHS